MTRSVAVDPARYRGDSHLAGLLARAGAGKSVADVRRLIAGVLAAPEDVDPDMWLGLVTPTPGDDLARQLQALSRTLEEGAARGLESPAPAWRLKALRHELQRTGLDGFIVPVRMRCGNDLCQPAAKGLTDDAPLQDIAGIAE